MKTCEKKLLVPKVSEQRMEREQVILEIKRLAEENLVPTLIFPDFNEMKIFLDDTKLGAQIRFGLKQFNIPLKKDWLQ